MDPQATFQDLLLAIETKNWTAAFTALENLWFWVARGGFTPKLPPNTYISIGDNNGTVYSILSHPWVGGYDFIKYLWNPGTGTCEERLRYTHKGPPYRSR